jgi:hypothetical protein
MAELGAGLEDRDNSEFFATLPTPPALIGGLTLLEEALVWAGKLGPEARVAVEAVVSLTRANVEAAGIAAVKASEEAALATFKRTRVRPEVSSFGFMVPRKRLEDSIRSQVIGLGAVGVGEIEELDSVVGTDGRPFWRTQEYGSTHNVGRIIYGLFQPGGAPPNEAEFRVHPVFVTGEVGSKRMKIRRPIPARHFLRAGQAAAALVRDREFGQTEATAIGEMRVIRDGLAAL